jgi:hypothetical protein
MDERIALAFNEDERELLEWAYAEAEVSEAERDSEMLGLSEDRLSGKLREKLVLDLARLRGYGESSSLKEDSLYKAVVSLSEKELPVPESVFKALEGRVGKLREQVIEELEKLGHFLLDDKSYSPVIDGFRDGIYTAGLDTVVQWFDIYMVSVEAFNFLTSNGAVKVTDRVPNIAESVFRERLIVRRADGTVRLATKQEVKKMPVGVVKEKIHLLPEDKERGVLLSAWVTTGDNKYLKAVYPSIKVRGKGVPNLKEVLGEHLQDIRKALRYIVSYEFSHEDIRVLIDTPKEVVYLDSAEDELLDNGKIIEMLKAVKKGTDPDYGTEYEKIAFNIARDALSRKSYSLTEKQSKIIESVYEKLQSAGTEKKKADSEQVAKAKEVLEELDKRETLSGKTPSSYAIMVRDIAGRMAKGLKCSEKQIAVVDKFYAGFKKRKDENEAGSPSKDGSKKVDSVSKKSEESSAGNTGSVWDVYMNLDAAFGG